MQLRGRLRKDNRYDIYDIYEKHNFEPEKKEEAEKTPILNPFALITWILLLGSVFLMAFIMNMGINMVVTVG